MEVTGLNKYYPTDASSKVGTKNNRDSEINMAEAFKKEVLNWKEKIKEKINEDLKNDREKNIKMSEKQWQALMTKVDCAINTYNENVNTAVKVDCSKADDEDKGTCDDLFAKILKEKEKSQLSTKDFLSSLTSDELYIIQKANGLASQIKVDKLSDEGAENLFLRPLGEDRIVDLNNDGVEEIGEAKMVFFPPPNAPDSVKKAWTEGTKDLSSEVKMKMFFKFIGKQLENNYTIDANGNPVERKPGESGRINIFGNNEESYINLFNSIIERIDKPLAGRDSKQIEEDELAKKVLINVMNLIEM